LERQIEDVTNDLTKRVLAAKDGQKSAANLGWLEHAETVLAFRTDPEKLTKEQKELVEKFNAKLEQECQKLATEDEKSRLARWREEITAINAARPKEPPRAYIWREDGTTAPITRILLRGEPDSPGKEVRPAVPAVLASDGLPTPTPAKKSTGRRLWLARWMTGPAAPLVARVMVNRIWQWTFGEGLVATENDFGVMGQPPSNAALLDYLATEFIQSGWSIKQIQGLLAKSSAFQRSVIGSERGSGADPDNVFLSRWKPRRLEAEVVRDSMLAVSGQLNFEMGGPSIFPQIPPSVLDASLSKRWPTGWGKSDERQAARRSIYIFVKRGMGVPELEALDQPDTTSSCEQRSVSTTGPQALTFINGDFALEQARHLTLRVLKEAGADVSAQISNAFHLVVSRSPSRREIAVAREFLAAQQQQIEADAGGGLVGDSSERALRALCSVLLNTNEFFYLN
jgi:hypothetical protein